MIRSIKWRLHNLKWWILHRFHPSHCYHVIHTGLHPGWHDRDLMMAVLIRKMVIDFVDLEKPYDHWETETSHYAEEWKRLKILYNDLKDVDVYDLSDDNYYKLNEKLIEAVKLRHLLWT
jgi:hypothetical protein